MIDKDIVIFKFPTQEQKSFAQIIYQKEFNRLCRSGIQTREEMNVTLKERNIWGDNQEEKLKTLQKRLESDNKVYRIFLSKRESKPFNLTLEDAEKNMIEISTGERVLYLDEERNKLKTQNIPLKTELVGVAKSIEDIENEMIDLQVKRNEFLKETAERLASEAKLHYYISSCALDSNKKQIWSYENFKDTGNNALVSFVIREYGDFLSGLDTRILRYLARTSFRTLWVTATKTSTPIFSGRTMDWNPNQVALCHYSMMYDAVYSLMNDERPPEYIIERDNMLDDWLDKRRESEERERRSNAGDGGSAMDCNEVIITASNPLYREFQEQGLFDSPGKRLKNKTGSEFQVSGREQS